MYRIDSINVVRISRSAVDNVFVKKYSRPRITRVSKNNLLFRAVHQNTRFVALKIYSRSITTIHIPGFVSSINALF